MEREKQKRKPRVPEGISRRINDEKTVMFNLIDGFEPKNSKGEKLIEEIMNCSIKKVSLNVIVELAILLSRIIQRGYSRNHKRNKTLTIKWFDENYDQINIYKPFVKIYHN